MEERPVAMSHSGELPYRLDHASLVVGKHDAHQRHVVTHKLFERIDGHITLTTRLNKVDLETGGTKQRKIVEHGIVLDGRYDDAIATALTLALTLRHAEKRKLIRFGSAGGQDDLGWANVCPEGPGNIPASLLELDGRGTTE